MSCEGTPGGSGCLLRSLERFASSRSRTTRKWNARCYSPVVLHDPKVRLLFAALVLLGCSSSPGSPADAGTPDAPVSAADAGGDAFAADGGSPDALPACGPNPLPAPCDVSASSSPNPGDFGADGTYSVEIHTLTNPHSTAPGPVSVYLPSGKTTVPVLFFSHAFGATDPASYDALFRHLASRGLAVVHVPYPNTPPMATKNADRYDCLWDGFLAAVAAYSTTFDLTRVGFFGHSYGGGATPEMARRGFVEKGWGSAGRLMFVMAPWYSWGSGYDTLPADVRTVIEVYADDDANDHQIAVHDVWDKLPASMEKAWLMIRTDVCGACGLNSPHTLPMTSGKANAQDVLNGYDSWGVWRRLDALAAYAFDGDAGARDVAYGQDSSMGIWTGCNGRAVRPLESSVTAPITSTCVPPQFPYADWCKYADPGVPCP